MLLRVSSKNLIVLGAIFNFIFSVGFAGALPAGLNNEGCEGRRQDQALLELRERLPSLDPVIVNSFACLPGDRCDGGFVWLPYMINLDRSWVLYTLPKKGNWVGVSLRNICSHRAVVRGDFLNETGSPYIDEYSAYALGWALDDTQELYSGYDNVAIQLTRPNGEFRVGVYGLDEHKLQSRLLDSFTVSPL